MRRTVGNGRGVFSQQGSQSIKSGKVRRSSRFSATLEVKEDWDIFIDSRNLAAEIGDGLMRHFSSTVRRDVNPETGRKNPKYYITDDGRIEERNNAAEMAKYLRRTNMNTTGRYASGWRVNTFKSRTIYYFKDVKASMRNKRESNRRGDGQAIWLGLGGVSQGIIANRVTEWMEKVIEGEEFRKDTEARAWGRGV